MLTHAAGRILALIASLVIAMALFVPQAAHATSCHTEHNRATGTATQVCSKSGSSGDDSSGPLKGKPPTAPAGISSCVSGGQEIPCVKNGAQWSAAKGCYLKKAPAKVQQQKDGGKNGKKSKKGNDKKKGSLGAWWTCLKPGGDQSTIWVNADDAFAGGLLPQINPADLARRAAASLHLTAPTIGIAPKTDPYPEDHAIVGMPVWLWVANPGPTVSGPITTSASDGGVTVTLKAHVDRYTWIMGDGHTVTCGSTGTAWKNGMTGASPSGCGHRYTKVGKFQVTATSSWIIEWTGGGMQGTIYMNRTNRTPMWVSEAQTVEK